MTSEQIRPIGAYVQFDRRRYEQPGTGLGLAIVQLLAQRHGGRLTIESTPGRQTTVCVTLPSAKRAQDGKPGSVQINIQEQEVAL